MTGTGLVGSARFPSPRDSGRRADQIPTQGYAGGTLLCRLAQHEACRARLPRGGGDRRAARPADGREPPRRGPDQPVFLLLRPIPPLAWIPLAIVWLGLGDAAKIMVIFFAAFVPSVINTYTGVRQIDPTFVAAARMLGALAGATGARCWCPARCR